MDGSKIIIFTETKRGADMLTRQLRMDGWPALAIHGDKSQAERDWVLAEFRDGKNPIMIATDVAARGLGILLCGWQKCHHPPPPFLLSSVTSSTHSARLPSFLSFSLLTCREAAHFPPAHEKELDSIA